MPSAARLGPGNASVPGKVWLGENRNCVLIMVEDKGEVVGDRQTAQLTIFRPGGQPTEACEFGDPAVQPEPRLAEFEFTSSTDSTGGQSEATVRQADVFGLRSAGKTQVIYKRAAFGCDRSYPQLGTYAASAKAMPAHDRHSPPMGRQTARTRVRSESHFQRCHARKVVHAQATVSQALLALPCAAARNAGPPCSLHRMQSWASIN